MADDRGDYYRLVQCQSHESGQGHIARDMGYCFVPAVQMVSADSREELERKMQAAKEGQQRAVGQRQAARFGPVRFRCRECDRIGDMSLGLQAWSECAGCHEAVCVWCLERHADRCDAEFGVWRPDREAVNG